MTESPRPSEMTRLIEKSSLGTPQARALRDLTDPSVVDRILNAETEVSATKPSTEPTPQANLEQTSDRELAERFAAGDQDAVPAVYQRYAEPILASALGRRDLADEVVQTTILMARQFAGRVSHPSRVAPLLRAIAYQVVKDVYRRESRAATPSELGDDDVAAVPQSFERTLEAGEVHNALDKLPPHEREVVRLFDLVGMTYQQVAERLGVPLGTVKSRLARARRRLAAMADDITPPPTGTCSESGGTMGDQAVKR